MTVEHGCPFGDAIAWCRWNGEGGLAGTKTVWVGGDGLDTIKDFKGLMAELMEQLG